VNGICISEKYAWFVQGRCGSFPSYFPQTRDKYIHVGSAAAPAADGLLQVTRKTTTAPQDLWIFF